MKQVKGGVVVRWTCGMAPVRIRPDCIDAIRDGSMDEDWYAQVVDQVFALTKAHAIEKLKQAVRWEVDAMDHVVDRRPSRLRVVSKAEGQG